MENTIPLLPSSGLKLDHLHIRGEYQQSFLKYHLYKGSSPHTWRILFKFLKKRSIRRDHLHIRGEYSNHLSIRMYSLGSSPHTWRILEFYGLYEDKVGIISTYVENTLKESYDSSILKRCNRPNTLLLPNFKALIFPH